MPEHDDLRTAFGVWGVEWDDLTPGQQTEFQTEIEKLVGSESREYSADLLIKAMKLVAGNGYFKTSLRTPGALMALGQLQALIDEAIQEGFGVSMMEGGEIQNVDAVRSVNHCVELAVAIGYVLHRASQEARQLEILFPDDD